MSSPRKSERQVRDWVLSVLDEKLAAQRRRAREILKPIAEKRRRGELTKRDVERGMRVLCFNNLAYCCSPKKKCGYRDELLKALGLTKSDYIEYKKTCEVVLWVLFISKGIVS